MLKYLFVIEKSWSSSEQWSCIDMEKRCLIVSLKVIFLLQSIEVENGDEDCNQEQTIESIPFDATLSFMIS